MISDVVVDCLFEELLGEALRVLHAGRIVMDPDDPEESFVTPDGYIVVRVKGRDPATFSRELERRVSGLRIVGVVDRTPKIGVENDPGEEGS